MKKILYSCLLLLWLFSCNQRNKYGIASYIHPPDSVSDPRTDTVDTNYAIYTLANNATHQLMQVEGDLIFNEKYRDGSKIIGQQLSINNEETVNGWQQWHVIYLFTENGIKYYQLRNVFSGKMLDVPENAEAENLQLQQYKTAEVATDRQLWRIQKAGDGQLFYIINKGNGLAVTSASTSNEDSTPVILQPLKNTSEQQWSLTLQPPVTYRDDEVVNFFNRNKSSQGSVAFDQGTSVPLSWGPNKGKVLWITQDAWDGSALQPNGQFKCTDFFQYRNSVLIQPTNQDWHPDNTHNMTREGSLQDRPKQIFDIVPNTEYAWPGAGVEIGNKVYIQCGEGIGLGTAVSQSLYELTENPNYIWDVKRTTPAGMTDQTEISYAAGMVKADDGYVYVYGTNYTGFGYTVDVHVARFPISNPQQWTFWSGTAWQSTPVTGPGSRIADGLGTATISYVNGKYVMITMSQGFNCDPDRDIYACWSDKPTGPFSARKKVYSIKEYLYGSYARYYTPAIHPEFDNGHKELLVTYCLNFSACGIEDCKDGFLDPYFYRVKGIRIPYSLIGIQ